MNLRIAKKILRKEESYAGHQIAKAKAIHARWERRSEKKTEAPAEAKQAEPESEAVEEPHVTVDMERRRLLAVDRAEALVRRARLLQRYVVLDDGDDVGVMRQVVDELLGE